MTAANVIESLGLPLVARVDQRVPKKLLVEMAAPTTADKQLISDGIEEVSWLAAIRPANTGIPAFRNEVQNYLEIAVVYCVLRAEARSIRIQELIHRAIPYPLVLLTGQGTRLTFSLAHKRHSQGETGKTVLETELLTADLQDADRATDAFLASLALSNQPRVNLLAVYQAWMDCTDALLAARLTGTFHLPVSPTAAAARRQALEDHEYLKREIDRLHAQAAKEKRMHQRVEINLDIQRLEKRLLLSRNSL